MQRPRLEERRQVNRCRRRRIWVNVFAHGKGCRGEIGIRWWRWSRQASQRGQVFYPRQRVSNSPACSVVAYMCPLAASGAMEAGKILRIPVTSMANSTYLSECRSCLILGLVLDENKCQSPADATHDVTMNWWQKASVNSPTWVQGPAVIAGMCGVSPGLPGAASGPAVLYGYAMCERSGYATGRYRDGRCVRLLSSWCWTWLVAMAQSALSVL